MTFVTGLIVLPVIDKSSFAQLQKDNIKTNILYIVRSGEKTRMTLNGKVAASQKSLQQAAGRLKGVFWNTRTLMLALVLLLVIAGADFLPVPEW